MAIDHTFSTLAVIVIAILVSANVHSFSNSRSYGIVTVLAKLYMVINSSSNSYKL